MNLLFAIDKGFTALFLSCVRSIVANGGDSRYTAYILHSDFAENEMDAINEAVGETVDCRFIPVDPGLFEGFPVSKRYPKQIYYRIAAPLLLPEDLDRVLYLDVDTVTINSLSSLYEMDFEGAYYIACTHTREFLTKVNQVRLGVKEDVPYINTGVMMLNLPELRKNLRIEDIRDYANRKQRSFILPDQDIITALYGENVKLADTMRYNLSDRILAFYNADPRNQRLDLDWVRRNGVIIHYCGKNKPWKEGYYGILNIFYQELTLKTGEGYKLAGQSEPEQGGEVQALTQSLSDMERALNEHYRDIGKMALELFEKEGREINLEVEKIIETRRRLTALQGDSGESDSVYQQR